MGLQVDLRIMYSCIDSLLLFTPLDRLTIIINYEVIDIICQESANIRKWCLLPPSQNQVVGGSLGHLEIFDCLISKGPHSLFLHSAITAYSSNFFWGVIGNCPIVLSSSIPYLHLIPSQLCRHMCLQHLACQAQPEPAQQPEKKIFTDNITIKIIWDSSLSSTVKDSLHPPPLPHSMLSGVWVDC